MKNDFINELEKLNDIEVIKNVKITSTMKISAIFKYNIIIHKIHMMKNVMSIINKYGVNYYILGNCSNVLFKKNYYDGVLIEIKVESNHISIIGANQLVSKVNSFYIKKGIVSLLFLTLVPCSIGGAIYMNAGAYRKEMKDIIEYVYFYDMDNDRIRVFNNKECDFSYRNSYFKNHNCLIFACKVKLEYLDTKIILNKMKDIIETRVKKIPYSYPSLGSIFKNPGGDSAGMLIDDCGLKGYRKGEAMISYQHANVIVNMGNCNSSDVMGLVEEVRQEVYKKHNKRLELEIILYE